MFLAIMLTSYRIAGRGIRLLIAIRRLLLAAAVLSLARFLAHSA
jgi:hypothetical protein